MPCWCKIYPHKPLDDACVCVAHTYMPVCLQDTNKVLAISRIMVAWQPLGLAMGTYDMCNRYLQQREQFGSPLAAFQVYIDSELPQA